MNTTTLEKSLYLVTNGLDGDSRSLVELKDLIIDELKLINAGKTGDKTRYKSALKYINSIEEKNKNKLGMWIDENNQYICDGFSMFRLSQKIEGLPEVENPPVNLQKLFNNFDSRHCQRSDFIEIENNLYLSDLKTQYALAKTEVKQKKVSKEGDSEYIMYNIKDEESNINRYFDIKKLIAAIEILKDFNINNYKLYIEKELTSQSPLYISNGFDSVMIMQIRRSETK